MVNDSEQVAAIRKRYKESFGEKADSLAAHAEALRESGGGDVCPGLHDDLHKLAGSSGMYGYADVALLCREIMRDMTVVEPDAVAVQVDDLRNLLISYS